MKKLLICIFLLVPLTCAVPKTLENKQYPAKKASKTNKIKLWRVIATVMTSKTGGNKLASGKQNTANKTNFVALPCRTALGRTIGIRSEVTKKEVRNVPVLDVGPWSIKDNYWTTGTRPKAERGVSDKYGKARNKAGIDLSLRLAKELGVGYPFKGEIVWWFENEG